MFLEYRDTLDNGERMDRSGVDDMSGKECDRANDGKESLWSV